MSIDFNNLYKVRIANPSKSFEKHEIVKLLICMKILDKHHNEKSYIHTYTEFVLKDGRKCDLFYENIKEKAGYIFEIQKNDSKDWEQKIIDFYRDFNVSYLNTTDLIIIRLNDLPDEIKELSKALDKFII